MLSAVHRASPVEASERASIMRCCHATSPPKRHTSMTPSSSSSSCYMQKAERKRTKAYPDHQLTVVGWCLGFLELEATVASSSWLLLVPCRAVPRRNHGTEDPRGKQRRVWRGNHCRRNKLLERPARKGFSMVPLPPPECPWESLIITPRPRYV